MVKRDTPAKDQPKKAAKADDTEKATRRNFGKNWLADSVEKVLRTEDYAVPLTVTTLRSYLTSPNTNGEKPSTGAVSACLTRWAAQGYIITDKKPLAFQRFTTKYKDKTLADFLDDQRAKRKKERAAAKVA